MNQWCQAKAWVVSVILVVLGCVEIVGAATTKEKPFYFGVCMYAYFLDAAAKDENVPIETFVDRHFKILSDHGVNAIYFGGLGPKNLDMYLAAAKKYGIKLAPQLDFVYFQSKWTDEYMAKRAKVAGEFIAKYKDRPEIIAWSVKEEVAYDDINKLAKYYTLIRQHVPDVKLYLVNNYFGAARDAPAASDTAYIGTDRYGFWWEFSGEGYLASPGFALNWTRRQAGQYYLEAARRGADFMMIVTQGGLIVPRSANIACKTPDKMRYPPTPQARQRMHERVLKYANENRMGWRKVTTDAGDFYAVWKYYRLPENCLKACAWASVLEGAKLFFVWSYTPRSSKWLAETGDITKIATLTSKGEVGWWTLAGHQGMPNRQLPEFAEASKEIRAYENVITQMVKIPNLTVKTETKSTYGQAFHIPTEKGLVLVLHNANVGTWPENSRYLFKETDQIFINDQGDMVGYTPYTDPLPVKFTCSKELNDAAGTVEGLFDLATGEALAAENGVYTTSIKPGSGVLLFLGTRDQAQKWKSGTDR